MSVFQDKVVAWAKECFPEGVVNDRVERTHRFLEEALELAQAMGCSRGEAYQLVDYVFDRPVGEIGQEVGGTMVTLAALCHAAGVDMAFCAAVELDRITQPDTIKRIRAKHAAKPKIGPLPGEVA